MLDTTTNGEHRKLIGVKTRLCLGTEYSLYCWDAASVSESELQPTEKMSDVLPNQQSHQVLYIPTCCVGCGTPLYFHYSVMWLSRWRYGEALRRDFLYTTKLESKFILRPTGIPSPEGKGLYLA